MVTILIEDTKPLGEPISVLVPTKYSFVNSDFLNNKVEVDTLSIQIKMTTVSGLDYINYDGTTCDIWFEEPLSSDDQEILNTVVDSHTGERLTTDSTREDSELFILSNKSVIATTSEDWKNVAKKENCFLSGGSYRFAWSYFWKALTDGENPFIETRAYIEPIVCAGGIELDTKGIFHKKRLSDGNSSQALSESGFTYINLPAGKYHVHLEYRRSGPFGTVAMANSNLEVLKASEDNLGSSVNSACDNLINYNYESITRSGVVTAIDSNGEGLSGVQLLLRLNYNGQMLYYDTLQWFTDANGEFDLSVFMTYYGPDQFYFGGRYNGIDYKMWEDPTNEDNNWWDGTLLQTGRAISNSETCVYFAPTVSGTVVSGTTWVTFEDDHDMQIWPGNYMFSFSDSFTDTEYTIEAGETTYIH